MPITHLSPDDLWRLRTRRARPRRRYLPPSPPDPAFVARERAFAAECDRIGALCEACRAKLQDPNEIDNPDLDAIEDCSFAALPACQRRRLIRRGQAVCPLDVWQCEIEPEPPQIEGKVNGVRGRPPRQRLYTQAEDLHGLPAAGGSAPVVHTHATDLLLVLATAIVTGNLAETLMWLPIMLLFGIPFMFPLIAGTTAAVALFDAARQGTAEEAERRARVQAAPGGVSGKPSA